MILIFTFFHFFANGNFTMEPKQTAETIPSWDGNPRGWRRYQREVAWYVLGTKKNQRALIGPRLVSKLTGPARLLAMSWNRTDIASKKTSQYRRCHAAIFHLQTHPR